MTLVRMQNGIDVNFAAPSIQANKPILLRFKEAHTPILLMTIVPTYWQLKYQKLTSWSTKISPHILLDCMRRRTLLAEFIPVKPISSLSHRQSRRHAASGPFVVFRRCIFRTRTEQRRDQRCKHRRGRRMGRNRGEARADGVEVSSGEQT